MQRRRTSTLLPWVGAAVLAVAAVGYLLARTQALPRGPQPIVWDQEACAHCRMSISSPRSAAQLQTQDGRVLDFDDPGCLMAYVAANRPHIHAVYFHAYDGGRWLAQPDAAFVPVTRTPMGYDLGAVPRGTPGALDYAAAVRRVLAREAALGGH
jgi:NosL